MEKQINLSSKKSKRPSDQKRERSRERILAAGAELLASQGIAGVHTNGIAQAAGVGVGTFYTHFPDKYALQAELVARGLASLQDALARAHRAAEAEPLEAQARATVSAFVDFAREQPALYRIIFSASDATARGGRASAAFSSRAMENRLGELQRAGQLDASLDVAVAARLFNAGQGQILLWWLATPEPPPREKLIETLVRLHPAVACQR